MSTNWQIDLTLKRVSISAVAGPGCWRCHLAGATHSRAPGWVHLTWWSRRVIEVTQPGEGHRRSTRQRTVGDWGIEVLSIAFASGQGSPCRSPGWDCRNWAVCPTEARTWRRNHRVKRNQYTRRHRWRAVERVRMRWTRDRIGHHLKCLNWKQLDWQWQVPVDLDVACISGKVFSSPGRILRWRVKGRRLLQKEPSNWPLCPQTRLYKSSLQLYLWNLCLQLWSTPPQANDHIQTPLQVTGYKMEVSPSNCTHLLRWILQSSKMAGRLAVQ